MKFTHKVVFITGASSGIGAATAIEFAKQGAKVSLTGRNAEKLEKTTQKCREAGLAEDDIFVVTGDIKKQEDCVNIVDKTLKHFGRIDVLVNNAGWVIKKTVMETTIEDLDAMLNAFVRAVFTMTQRALPSIIENKGAIVNVSSVASQCAYVQAIAYGVAKSAMDQYAKILALEMADKGVRVNTVNPGVVLTNLSGDIDSEATPGMTVKNVVENFANLIHPNKKVVRPEDVGKAVAFLASEDAAMITGVTLPVDGGLKLAGPQKDKIEDMKERLTLQT